MKKRILVDLDDVICDASGWMYIINTVLGTNYTVDDAVSYYLQDLVPEEKKNDYFNFFRTQNTYDHCNVNPDCGEVLKKLYDKYDLYICSAYVYRDDVMYSAEALKFKFEFLMKNFPFIDPHRFIFLTDKSIVKCDIRLDDKINNLEDAETKILYTAYHNKDISDEELKSKNIIRANSWKDVAKILEV